MQNIYLRRKTFKQDNFTWNKKSGSHPSAVALKINYKGTYVLIMCFCTWGIMSNSNKKSYDGAYLLLTFNIWYLSTTINWDRGPHPLHIAELSLVTNSCAGDFCICKVCYVDWCSVGLWEKFPTSDTDDQTLGNTARQRVE